MEQKRRIDGKIDGIGGKHSGLTIVAGKEKSPKPLETLRVSDLVPVTGLEPVRCRQRWILSPLRLPFHHTGRCVIIKIFTPAGDLFVVAAFGSLMSPTFAVPGECPCRPAAASLADRCTFAWLRHRRRSGSQRWI